MEAEALNIPAVIAGAVAGFVLGAVLYHPRVLGGVWARGTGVDLDAGGAPPVMAFLYQAAALVCLALVVGQTATVNFLGTALLAILAVLFFVVAGGAFQRKSPGALSVDALYVALAGAMMIAAQGLL